MRSRPWWIERAQALVAGPPCDPGDAGAYWHLAECLQFIQENVLPAQLRVDLLARPDAVDVWASLQRREREVLEGLRVSVALLAERVRSGALGPMPFRLLWEGLGFVQHAQGAGSPADDHLDALFHVSRLTTGEAVPVLGLLNVSSRASQISDFLRVTEPTAVDVVFDLGSGNGKLALTVAASSNAQVRGVECAGGYCFAARGSAATFGLHNAHFLHSDVREVDLSTGTVFYLYYPFHGEVARAVAGALGGLARVKDITVYLSGPTNGFAEHFLQEVEEGAFILSEKRGEFAEVLVLRSRRT